MLLLWSMNGIVIGIMPKVCVVMVTGAAARSYAARAERQSGRRPTPLKHLELTALRLMKRPRLAQEKYFLASFELRLTGAKAAE